MFDMLTLVKTSKPQEGQADLFQEGLHTCFSSQSNNFPSKRVRPYNMS
jgi:hypothetical protein